MNSAFGKPGPGRLGKLWAGIRAAFRDFSRDRRGATTIYVVFAGTLALSGGVLALDIGRVVVLRSQMQNAADAAALSAAAQLDGQDGAITRATAAASDAISNTTNLASNDSDFVVQSIVFYDGVEANSSTTTDEAAAVAAAVTLTPRTISIFLAPVLQAISSGSVANEFTLDGTARAGVSTIVCDVPPFMVCNPAEDGNSSDDVLDPANAGRQLLTKEGPGAGGGSLAPGNFGLLCPSTGNCGAASVSDALANEPGLCYTSEVTTSPGSQTQQARNGINARMDAGNKNPKNPAPNIQSYGRDSDMSGSTILGNGIWVPGSYWPAKHSGDALPADLSDSSRYQAYLYELGETFYRSGKNTIYPTDGITLPSGYTTVTPAGVGLPSEGTPTPTASTDPKRRVLKVAVLDCTALGVQGSGTYPTFGRYVEVFLTEEVSDTQSATYTEIIGPLINRYSTDIHVNVQLIE
jgi:Flp pilus assembly protein TadG